MRNKYLIIIMSLIIIFNFISIPKSQAVGVSFVAQYGLPYAEKLIAFLYASLAIGVTFNAVDEAEKMLDKWLLDEPNWEPPQDSWKNLIQTLLVGSVGVDAISNLYDSIKDWIQSIGGSEGENIFSVGENIKYIESTQMLVPGTNIVRTSTKYSIINYTIEPYDETRKRHTIQSTNDIYSTVDTKSTSLFEFNSFHNSTQNRLYMVYENGSRLSYLFDSPQYILDTIPSESTHQSINYNIRPNSYPITDIPPDNRIQPEIDILPLEEKIDEEGKTGLIYPGTTEELTEEMIDSLTWEDYIKSSTSTSSVPYTLTETQTGTEIQTGTITDSPFENPNETPTPESELEGQKSIIVLLKSIINWISQIPKMISTLFVPTTELTLEPIKNIPIAQKWPFSIPFDLLKTFTNLRSTGVAPKWEMPLPQATGLDIDVDEFVIDFAIFNPIANLVRILLSILFLIGILVLTWKVFI